jgi:hypothetical protein
LRVTRRDLLPAGVVAPWAYASRFYPYEYG